MKTYKVRLNCTSFVDVVVQASSKEEAKEKAGNSRPNCRDQGFEFGEFLTVEEGDEIEVY